MVFDQLVPEPWVGGPRQLGELLGGGSIRAPQSGHQASCLVRLLRNQVRPVGPAGLVAVLIDQSVEDPHRQTVRSMFTELGIRLVGRGHERTRDLDPVGVGV